MSRLEPREGSISHGFERHSGDWVPGRDRDIRSAAPIFGGTALTARRAVTIVPPMSVLSAICDIGPEIIG
jgi:hypothetical protein